MKSFAVFLYLRVSQCEQKEQWRLYMDVFILILERDNRENNCRYSDIVTKT